MQCGRPGWIDTELDTGYIESMSDPTAFREELATIHPVGHTGAPEDVAELVYWLASDAARFVTDRLYR